MGTRPLEGLAGPFGRFETCLSIAAGSAVVPGALFYPDGSGGDSLRLSFSMVDEAQIAPGVELLASVL